MKDHIPTFSKTTSKIGQESVSGNQRSYFKVTEKFKDYLDGKDVNIQKSLTVLILHKILCLNCDTICNLDPEFVCSHYSRSVFSITVYPAERANPVYQLLLQQLDKKKHSTRCYGAGSRVGLIPLQMWRGSA